MGWTELGQRSEARIAAILAGRASQPADEVLAEHGWDEPTGPSTLLLVRPVEAKRDTCGQELRLEYRHQVQDANDGRLFPSGRDVDLPICGVAFRDVARCGAATCPEHGVFLVREANGRRYLTWQAGSEFRHVPVDGHCLRSMADLAANRRRPAAEVAAC